MFRFGRIASARCSCFDTSARAVKHVRPEVSKGRSKSTHSLLNEYRLTRLRSELKTKANIEDLLEIERWFRCEPLFDKLKQGVEDGKQVQ